MANCKYAVTCACGRVGYIVSTEYPASDIFLAWTLYVLQDLEGAGSYAAGKTTWDRVFHALSPRCPTCRRYLVPGDLDEVPPEAAAQMPPRCVNE